jgi:hypothetical protein
LTAIGFRPGGSGWENCTQIENIFLYIHGEKQSQEKQSQEKQSQNNTKTQNTQNRRKNVQNKKTNTIRIIKNMKQVIRT